MGWFGPDMGNIDGSDQAGIGDSYGEGESLKILFSGKIANTNGYGHFSPEKMTT
jgi:hypothetical protein